MQIGMLAPEMEIALLGLSPIRARGLWERLPSWDW